MAMRAQQRITAQHMEQAMQARRVDEKYHNDLQRYNQENTMLNHAAQNEQRLAFQRRNNDHARMMGEQLTEERILQQEAHNRTKARMQDQNQKLAEEMQKRRAEKIRNETEIQRICNESEELKALEQRLKVAYLNKERAVQHQERRNIKLVEEELEQAIADKMEHDRQQALRAEAQKAEARREVAGRQREMLQQQMAERQMYIDEAAKEAERDRAMVAEVVARIEAEERAEASTYARKREETREVAREAERQRAVELEARRKREQQEEEDIQRHMELIRAREAQIEQERSRKKAIADANFQRVVEQTEKQRNEEEELRMLRDMLWEEELEAKLIAEDEARKRKVIEDKHMMMAANELQLAQRRERRKFEKEEEQRLIQTMLRQYKLDEEREQREAQARLAMKHEHKHHIQQQRDERVRLYQQEKALEMEEMERERQKEEYKKRVIAEARRRLLEQHAAALEGFLPKGALQSKEELQYVQQVAHRRPEQHRY